MHIRWEIANEAPSAELAIIISVISNKLEWNNCVIKNAHKISRIRLPNFICEKQPIFSLFLILSRRVQLPCFESMV